MLALLLESAVRSLVLGAVVSALARAPRAEAAETGFAPAGYRLAFSDDFDDTNWNASGSNILATEGTAVTTDAVGEISQRFYRVVLLP